jgi:hypothetical protein
MAELLVGLYAGWLSFWLAELLAGWLSAGWMAELLVGLLAGWVSSG